MSQGLCPSCGAVANLTAQQNQINCAYCGSVATKEQVEHELKEGKRSKEGALLVLADSARESGNYEEAINYYNRVIEQDPNYAYAWLSKGTCIALQSTFETPRYNQAFSVWNTAIKVGGGSSGIKKAVAEAICDERVHLQFIRSTFDMKREKHLKHTDLLSLYFEFVSLFDSIPSLTPDDPYIINCAISYKRDSYKSIMLKSDDENVSFMEEQLVYMQERGGSADVAAAQRSLEEAKQLRASNRADNLKPLITALDKADPTFREKQKKIKTLAGKAKQKIHSLVRVGQKEQAIKEAVKVVTDIGVANFVSYELDIRPTPETVERFQQRLAGKDIVGLFGVDIESWEIFLDDFINSQIDMFRFNDDVKSALGEDDDDARYKRNRKIEEMIERVKEEYACESESAAKEILKSVFKFDTSSSFSPTSPNDTSPAGQQNKKEGCFIATVCYGDYEHPVVVHLRLFRDQQLEPTGWGRAFIRWYYKWGPSVAAFISRSNFLKKVVRVAVIQPAALIARMTNGEHYAARQ